MAKPRKLGYIFPRRINSAIAGETSPFGSKFYQGGVDKNEAEELQKKKEEESAERIEKQKVLADARSPWTCPTCTKIMRNKLDQKYYNRRGMCMDCTLKAETYLKVKGLFDEFEKQISLRNYKAYMIDVREQAVDFVNNLKEESKIVNHDGTFDTLKGDITQVKEFMLKEIEDIDKKLEEVKDIDMNVSAEEFLGINLKEITKNILMEEEKRGEHIIEQNS